ncbi:hypothetical protein GQ457_05G013010 [Hibiscus cannabinus]
MVGVAIASGSIPAKDRKGEEDLTHVRERCGLDAGWTPTRTTYGFIVPPLLVWCWVFMIQLRPLCLRFHTLGGIGSNAVAIVMAGHVFWGTPGWRCAFVLMATLSSLIGLLVFLFVVDPRKTVGANRDVGYESDRDEMIVKGTACASSVWFECWRTTKAVIKVPTFQIIVLQGIVGSLPWTAMVFFTTLFELIGSDHSSTAVLLSLFAIGCAIGSFLGSWNATAANGPMFAEVVPTKHRTMI